jgi:hypothetical protein
MSSILCSALRFGRYDAPRVHHWLQADPPATLFSTASLFSALAPRASRFCILTPPLLALLRRSPFYSFTQHFQLGKVTDADVCQIIRECVAIKSLRVWGTTMAGSFIQDAILSGDGGFITRTLEELTCYLGDQGTDLLVPLLLFSTSPMTLTFLRLMASQLLWSENALFFSSDAKRELLHSALDALEGRRDELWEPSLMFVACLIARQKNGFVFDERVVRRCIAAVEELIDAEERVALLAVELLTRLLEHCAELVVPLLLSESDVMRGVLMLCDRYVARIKRGHRVISFLDYEWQHMPLRVIEIAIQRVIEVAPTCDVLQVLSYRDADNGHRVRTALDIIIACRSCPKVSVMDCGSRDAFKSIVADPEHGERDVCRGLEHAALTPITSTWPRPFSVHGSPARQKLLNLLTLQVQDAFARCDQLVAVDPVAALTDRDTAESRDSFEWIGRADARLRSAVQAIEPALCLVDKGDDGVWDRYSRANAHVPTEQLQLDRVRFFNFLLSIRPRCDDDPASLPAGGTRSLADVLLELMRARLRFERPSCIERDLRGDALGREGDVTWAMLDFMGLRDQLIESGEAAAQRVAWFLVGALADSETLLDEHVCSEDDDAHGEEQPEETASTTTDRRRQRPDDKRLDEDDQSGEQTEQQQLDDDDAEMDEEQQRFWADARAEATKGLDSIVAILRLPDVVQALVSIELTQSARDACKTLLDFAVERGCATAEELEALRAAALARLAPRSE